MTTARRRLPMAGLMAVALAAPALAQPADALEAGFREPPASAKPRAWWQWINGNVTREGITLDLEWMKRAGFGGAQWFDVAIGVPQLVDKRVVYQSPEWWEMVRHAASETDRLGLQLTAVASPGWSETGAPHVKPEQAMKKVVWAETRLRGPGRPKAPIATPPEVSGPFQNVPATPFVMPETPLPGSTPTAGRPPPIPTLYRDLKVLAWPAPAGDTPPADLDARVTSNGGPLDAALLRDDDLVKKQPLAGAEPGKPIWVQYEFARPQTIRAAHIGIGTGGSFGGTSIPIGGIEASDDGKAWRRLANLPGQTALSAPSRTYAFADTQARYFRFVFTTVPPSPMAVFGATTVPKYDVGELAFLPAARVNRFEEKAGFGTLHEMESLRTPEPSAGAAIAHGRIVDLTSRLRPDGTLDWDVPPGEWVVMRFGASLTGKLNTPAPVEAQGLEVDKLNRAHVTAYLDGFIAPLLERLPPPARGSGFTAVETDSWEAGQQTWTDDMAGEFKRRRGYDLTPWLPALAGRVVSSAAETDKFLWDWRRTIADLISENHYGTIRDWLHARGLAAYGEATGVKTHTISDGIQAKSYTDMPIGEFWLVPMGAPSSPDHISDIREAASAAHVYGKPIVGAEAFTVLPQVQDPWKVSPWQVKWLADRFLALGVNQFQVSTSVHQPFADRKPGVTLGPFGQHFTRTQTWAELARPWVDYLSRSSFLLQQGRTVSDVAFFYGEGAPATAPWGEPSRPEIPAGYAWDYVNADAIRDLMSVKDGMIVLPSGQSYRMLVLPQSLDRMSLSLLAKIRDLVAAGATVVGPKPLGSPGLGDSDGSVRAIADEVWSRTDGRTLTESAYGKGRVYWGQTPAAVLRARGWAPDVDYSRPRTETNLAWTHRTTGETDIYFVANQTPQAERLEVSFRTAGREAEIWRADTGATTPAPYRTEGARTIVPLQLDPWDAVFVVFRTPASTQARAAPAQPVEQTLSTLSGEWRVTFPPNLGAPAEARLRELASWTANAEAGVRFFSGTATYSKDLSVLPEWLKSGQRVVLDLGDVREMAEVAVNGRSFGLLWKPPFKVDITEALKPGANRLEVKVTNVWANRMIGDAQPGAGKPFTYVTTAPYPPGTPLAPSGLLGPARLTGVAAR